MTAAPVKAIETNVITDILDVRARLGQLGLTLELLSEAALAWVRAEASTSPFEPPTAPGSKGWFACTGVLREQKVAEGWKAKNIRNWPIVVDLKTSIALSATSGDSMTGLVLGDLQPATKNRKGIVVRTAVRRSIEQMTLPGFPAVQQTAPERVGKKAARRAAYITWVLLVFVTPEGARIELSLPSMFEGDRIVRWRERIILPSVTRAPVEIIGSEEAEPIDVPVERRA